MKEISKRTAIDKIIHDEVETIAFEIQQNGYSERLNDLLENQYFEVSKAELQRELNERFDSEYIINNNL